MKQDSRSGGKSQRVSALLWAINLCAISAATLSYIYLSYFTYNRFGSLLLSQAVLVSPMVLPVLLVSQIQRVAQRVSPRSLLLFSNLLSLFCCIFVYALLSHTPLVALVGGVVIGSLDAVQRVARMVAIKSYFRAADIKLTVPLTLTAQFIAGGLAGGLMSVFRDRMTPPVALCVTSLLFGVAAVAAGLLPLLARGPDSPSPARALWPTFVGLLHTNKDMKRSFWGFVAFVSIYQGFFNVSRVTLPAHVLHLSESYVGLLQVVNSIAALIGAIVYYSTSRQGDRLAPLAMSITSAAFMITTASGFGVVSSYAAYFFYIFFFELAFFRLQADVVVNSPSQDMPLVASVQYAAVYAGMIATTFIGSILVERVGLMRTSVIFVGVYAAAIAVRPNVFRPAVQ